MFRHIVRYRQKEGMPVNSRERVRAVLNHQLPDRIPNGLGGCETVGLHIVAYDNLQRFLGWRL